jgi:hypothetical protein
LQDRDSALQHLHRALSGVDLGGAIRYRLEWPQFGIFRAQGVAFATCVVERGFERADAQSLLGYPAGIAVWFRRLGRRRLFHASSPLPRLDEDGVKVLLGLVQLRLFVLKQPGEPDQQDE